MCDFMSIAPISAVNFSTTVQPIKKTGIDKKAEPIAVQPQKVENSGEALRSYFLGSKAVSFGFSCSTSKFVTKKMEDVPCCCCGGKMPAGLPSVLSGLSLCIKDAGINCRHLYCFSALYSLGDFPVRLRKMREK